MDDPLGEILDNPLGEILDSPLGNLLANRIKSMGLGLRLWVTP
jgi:hypothetical protein